MMLPFFIEVKMRNVSSLPSSHFCFSFCLLATVSVRGVCHDIVYFCFELNELICAIHRPDLSGLCTITL